MILIDFCRFIYAFKYSFFLCKIAGPEAVSRHAGCDTILQSGHGLDDQKLCKFQASRNGHLSKLLNLLLRIIIG